MYRTRNIKWLAVDKNGSENIFCDKPKRSHDMWWGDGMVIPKGCIKKLIGRELTWEDNCVELKEE